MKKIMMRCTCHIALVIILLTTGLHSLAQQTATGKFFITGRVLDSSQQKPVAYATINLLDTGSTPVAAAFSDESGVFKLPVQQKGAFNIEISFVGFQTRLIAIQVQDATVLLGNIYLKESAGVLDEVKVTARKKLIEQRPGMLVYNAENDLTNKGGTAADVLRKAPVLNVDAQGNVSMRGSSNLKILVNGKYSGQMARSPADALNMMPADNIKSVEVITTPSAKYDAEGAAGVINIITKKNNAELSGALELSVSNLEQMLNPRIAYAKGKWAMSFHGHIHRLRRKEGSSLNRKNLTGDDAGSALLQEVESDNAAPHGSGDLNITYTADSLTELSLAVNTWVGNWPDNNRRNTSLLAENGAVQESFSQDIKGRSRYLGSDVSVGYSRKFIQPGQELSVLAQFTPARDKSDYDALQMNEHNVVLYRELNNSKTTNREWTLQVDYLQPLSKTGKYSLESGVKGVFRNVNNKYLVLASNSMPVDELVEQADRSDLFRYKQNVLAGYSMLKINMKGNWYAEAGARLEYTLMEGRFESGLNTFTNSFTNFVPTATISKKMNDGQSITMSYTKRLTRPYIWDLNPNANASDPKNISTGNPALQPEIAHQAEVSYNLTAGASYFINTALFWKKTNGAIVDYTEIGSNGTSVTSKQNLAGNMQTGLNLSSSFAISPSWSINGNINVNYLDYSSDALKIFNDGWAADFSLNSIMKLPRNYGIQLFGEYNTRSITLQGYDSYRYYYSLAFKKGLPKAKINITLAAVNPFDKYIRQTVILNTPAFASSSMMRYYNRAVKLTINWEFGGSFQQRERKRISNDDVNVQGRG